MTIGFDCMLLIATQQKGIPKGNWNTLAKQGYAEKTFGIPKGTAVSFMRGAFLQQSNPISSRI
jgi:hypothetical protein